MKRTVPSSSVCYFGRRPSPVGAALRSLGNEVKEFMAAFPMPQF